MAEEKASQLYELESKKGCEFLDNEFVKKCIEFGNTIGNKEIDDDVFILKAAKELRDERFTTIKAKSALKEALKYLKT